MRIATWNLAGRWSSAHAAKLDKMNADVLLLTEVNERLCLDGYVMHRAPGLMAARRRWSAILSRRPITTLPGPHAATVAVQIDAVTYWSSVLPWRSSPGEPMWPGDGHADKTRSTLTSLLGNRPKGPLIWGGDWNHAFGGWERAGSLGGRKAITAALAELDLICATSRAPHRVAGYSIDHIAIPADWHSRMRSIEHFTSDGLSDHDAYAVDVER
jgi:hypothetical protein